MLADSMLHRPQALFAVGEKQSFQGGGMGRKLYVCRATQMCNASHPDSLFISVLDLVAVLLVSNLQ